MNDIVTTQANQTKNSIDKILWYFNNQYLSVAEFDDDPNRGLFYCGITNDIKQNLSRHNISGMQLVVNALRLMLQRKKNQEKRDLTLAMFTMVEIEQKILFMYIYLENLMGKYENIIDIYSNYKNRNKLGFKLYEKCYIKKYSRKFLWCWGQSIQSNNFGSFFYKLLGNRIICRLDSPNSHFKFFLDERHRIKYSYSKSIFYMLQ